MLEDTLLKLRFNRGDRDALRRIYEKYKDDLLRLAAALLHDVDQAEDAVHDAFVVFTKSMGDLCLTGNLKSLLTTCVINQARNAVRARQRKRTVRLDEGTQVKSDAPEPQQAAILSEAYQRLRHAIAELPYEQQEIIILHLQNNMRFRHIAKLQNISINTAKSRYRCGLGKLRSRLDNEVTT